MACYFSSAGLRKHVPPPPVSPLFHPGDSGNPGIVVGTKKSQYFEWLGAITGDGGIMDL